MSRVLMAVTLLVIAGASHALPCADNLVPAVVMEADRGFNPAVQQYLAAVQDTVLFAGPELENSYCGLREWYEDKQPVSRFSSRLLSLLVIALGALLPLIGILDRVFVNQRLWVASVGATIIMAQGLSQTFEYEQTWKDATTTAMAMERAHRDWQLQIIDAALDPADGFARAQTATQQFEDHISDLVAQETQGFFQRLQEDSAGVLRQGAPGSAPPPVPLAADQPEATPGSGAK